MFRSYDHLQAETLNLNCEFIDVEHPFWREDGYVIHLYNFFWTLPEQSLSSPRPAELKTICYSFQTSSTSRTRSPYLYHPGIGWPSGPRALGYLLVASYDSQGYGEGILTRLHTLLLVTY
jgi:hypothetical protein